MPVGYAARGSPFNADLERMSGLFGSTENCQGLGSPESRPLTPPCATHPTAKRDMTAVSMEEKLSTISAWEEEYR